MNCESGDTMSSDQVYLVKLIFQILNYIFVEGKEFMDTLNLTL